MDAAERIGPPGVADHYRAEQSDLVRLAFLLSGSRELAEDAVQSVFADAQCRWGEIDNHRAYLRRAVSNRVKDGQRRAFRRRTLPPDPEVVTGVPPIDETWAVVCSLPPRQREVVVLRFYEDLSLFEIAATLGRKEATIRSDLRRALIRLRRTIRE